MIEGKGYIISMPKRIPLAACILLMAATTTASAAGIPKPPKPPAGPTLNITPLVGASGAPMTIVGKLFAPQKSTHVELDCPMVGHIQHGQWKWTPKTDKHGTFTIKSTIPKPKKVKSSLCHVYALDVTKKGSFYVSTQFNIR
jgi:hypothetical protein